MSKIDATTLGQMVVAYVEVHAYADKWEEERSLATESGCEGSLEQAYETNLPCRLRYGEHVHNDYVHGAAKQAKRLRDIETIRLDLASALGVPPEVLVVNDRKSKDWTLSFERDLDAELPWRRTFPGMHGVPDMSMLTRL